MSTQCGCTSIELARQAKEKFANQFGMLEVVNSIGITRLECGTFAVKVGLRETSTQVFPSTIDGVPIVLEIIGLIRPLISPK